MLRALEDKVCPRGIFSALERHFKRTQINNKVLRNDKNHQLGIHRKCLGARISLMQNVESEEWNIIKVHRSQINISVVPKAIKTSRYR